jgi:uncharacterized protein (DUF2164 family)
MSIALAPEARKQALASLERYCADEFEGEVSGIQVAALLEFFLKEIAPTVYNAAIRDAETFMRARLDDLEATCFEEEFTYWPKGDGVRRK